MITWILAVLGLYFVQTFLPAGLRYSQAENQNPEYLLGARDNPAEMSVNAKRLTRALNNLTEALVIFLPLALLLEMKGIDQGFALNGAMIFFWARVAYVPAYVSAIPFLRSAIWGLGHVGLGMMVWALCTGHA